MLSNNGLCLHAAAQLRVTIFSAHSKFRSYSSRPFLCALAITGINELIYSIAPWCALSGSPPMSQDVPYLAVTGFLFLRFFVPAILSPKLFALREEHSDQRTERTLKLIAKVTHVWKQQCFQLLLLSCQHYVNLLFSDMYFSPLSLTLPPPPSPLLPLPSSSHLPLPRFIHQVLQSVSNLQLEMDAKEACMKPMSEILPRSVERLKTFVQEILQVDQKTGEL